MTATEPGRPPDDWDVDDKVPTPPPVGRPKKTKTDRPLMDPQAETLRTMWIMAVRAHHARRGGRPSTYDSNRQWDGGRDSVTGRTVRPVWPTLVARAATTGVSVHDLLRATFENRTVDEAPVPYDLVSDATVARARHRRACRRTAIEQALRVEESLFRSGAWGMGQSVPDPDAASRFVLNDVGRALSPLFRYSVAVSRGYADVAARWRVAAVAQLAEDPAAYMEFWNLLIPQDMRETVEPTAGK